MRGEDRQQAAMFSYLSPEVRVPRDHPLRAIGTMVDAALTELYLANCQSRRDGQFEQAPAMTPVLIVNYVRTETISDFPSAPQAAQAEDLRLVRPQTARLAGLAGRPSYS
jgi:hypothetical protein